MKRKQYDAYGTTGFNAGQAGGGQQYWSGHASNVDPEELFRKIFGEFSGGRGFGDFSSIFEQPQEVREILKNGVKVKSSSSSFDSHLGSFTPLHMENNEFPSLLVFVLFPPPLTVHHGADVYSGSKGRQQRNVS